MLTQRKEAILRNIVGEYIATAIPVASEIVARKPGVAVSPATVRNEMADLEEEGYIRRPHTSAGGVPLDRGYRFYVESLPYATELAPEVRFQIRSRLTQVDRDLEAWTSMAATILAELVRNMTITTFPRAVQSRLRHLELVYLQEFLALLVLVLQESRLRQHLVPLREPMSPDELSLVAGKLKAHMAGLNRKEIEATPMELSPFEGELKEITLRIMNEEDELFFTDHDVSGLRHLLSQPEFARGEQARGVLEVLEAKSVIQSLLRNTSEGRVVKVIIGEENPEECLHPFSVVLCQYGIPEAACGVVSVIGPTRMEYSRTISGVRFVSALMSQLVEDIFG